MKNRCVVSIFLVMVLCFFTSCARQQKDIEIYSFSGSNDIIALNNGLIIITDDLEKFIGGDLTFKGEELPNIKNSSTKFYFFKDGVENTIQNNSDSIEGSNEGTKIQQDTGSTSSKDLFYGNDLESIKQSLNIKISGTFMSGEKFEYNFVLDVKKVY